MIGRKWTAPIVALLLLAAACGGGDDEDDSGATTGAPDNIEVTSTEFEDGGEIPEDFSCDGRNHSPALRWSKPPSGTESQVIIMDDPDAGDYVHWVLYDLEPDLGGLDRIGQTETLPGGGGAQGVNSSGDFGYAGPCPPEGQTHTYVFRVYALDAALGREPGASREDVDDAMEGHVLASGELTGTFGR
jgi:Raf kinase inhibitor-like YbhB/YbcL family protein